MRARLIVSVLAAAALIAACTSKPDEPPQHRLADLCSPWREYATTELHFANIYEWPDVGAQGSVLDDTNGTCNFRHDASPGGHLKGDLPEQVLSVDLEPDSAASLSGSEKDRYIKNREDELAGKGWSKREGYDVPVWVGDFRGTPDENGVQVVTARVYVSDHIGEFRTDFYRVSTVSDAQLDDAIKLTIDTTRKLSH
jgi:hypothetical protein